MKSFLEKTARALGLIKEIGVSIAGLEKRINSVENESVILKNKVVEGVRAYFEPSHQALRVELVMAGGATVDARGWLPTASASAPGLMSAADYTALHKAASGGEPSKELIKDLEIEKKLQTGLGSIKIKLTKADGSQVVRSITLTPATSSSCGLMRAADYTALLKAGDDIQELRNLIDALHPEAVGLDTYAIELQRTWNPASSIMDSNIPDYQRLKILPPLDTSNVVNIDDAFRSSKVIKIISLDLPAVESIKVGSSFGYAFPNTLQEIGRIALPNCKTGFSKMFCNRTNLERIDEFELPQNNTYTFFCTFEGCTSLVNLGEVDLRQCTSLQSAFNKCSALTRLSLKTSPTLTNLRFAFHSCKSLEVIDGDIDCTNITNMVQPIALCENLKRVNFINLGAVPTYEEKGGAIRLHRAPQWGADGEENYASLVNSLLVNSFDRTAAGYEPVILYLSTAVVERLGEENVAAIRAKGFIVTALDEELEPDFYD